MKIRPDGHPFCVLCATDIGYVPYCGIMITSLFESNRDLDISVYILTDAQLPAAEQHRFRSIASKYNQQIEIVKVDRSIFENYPSKNMSYWSVAMYYRILAPDLLPVSVERVLYLDCDIIVNGSIRQLQSLDIGNYAIGTVDDICCFDKDDTCIRLRYPCSCSYFNSGMMLINLRYWRDNDIAHKCMDFLFSNYEILSANDQDMLNAVLHDKVLSLPLTYNYQVLFLKKDIFNQYPAAMQQRILDVYNPLIIHYAMQMKPWDVRYYRMPFDRKWKSYKRRSPWRFMPPYVPRPHVLKYIIKRYLLWPLGIMYNWTGNEFLRQ